MSKNQELEKVLESYLELYGIVDVIEGYSISYTEEEAIKGIFQVETGHEIENYEISENDNGGVEYIYDNKTYYIN